MRPGNGGAMALRRRCNGAQQNVAGQRVAGGMASGVEYRFPKGKQNKIIQFKQ
jgi:hypothetical protein